MGGRRAKINLFFRRGRLNDAKKHQKKCNRMERLKKRKRMEKDIEGREGVFHDYAGEPGGGGVWLASKDFPKINLIATAKEEG